MRKCYSISNKSKPHPFTSNILDKNGRSTSKMKQTNLIMKTSKLMPKLIIVFSMVPKPFIVFQ